MVYNFTVYADDTQIYLALKENKHAALDLFLHAWMK